MSMNADGLIFSFGVILSAVVLPIAKQIWPGNSLKHFAKLSKYWTNKTRKYLNTQIFTLANPVHFGLKWFVTEEEILAVFTVYEWSDSRVIALRDILAVFTVYEWSDSRVIALRDERNFYDVIHKMSHSMALKKDCSWKWAYLADPPS